MGSDITPDNMRGFLLPLPLSSGDIWTAQSTNSTAEKRAGIPVPSANEKLVITTSGEQESPIDLKTKTGGTPGQKKAGFVWKRSTDANFYGDNSPNAITDFQFLEKEVTGGTPSNYGAPSALALSSGDILVSFFSSEFGGQNGIVVRRCPIDSASFSSGTLVFDAVASATIGTASSPAMCQLSDGSVILIHWVVYTSPTSANEANIYVYRSIDGISFNLISAGALDTNISTTTYSLGRLHLEEWNSQLMMIGDLTYAGSSDSVDIIIQAASIDEGVTFQEIGSRNDNHFCYKPSLISTQDGFLLSYITSTNSGASSDGYGMTFLFPNAFFPFANKNTAITNQVLTYLTGRLDAAASNHPFLEGDHTSWIDEEGVIYLIFKNLSTQSNTKGGDGGLWMVMSFDNGKTWQKAGGHKTEVGIDPTTTSISPYIFSMNDDNHYLENFHACSGKGKSWLFSQFKTSAGTLDDSILCLGLRGYSSVTLPGKSVNSGITQSFGYNHTLLPFLLPDLLPDWTVAGTSTVSVEKSGINLTSSTTTTRVYTYTFAPDSNYTDSGIISRFVMRAVSGGDIATDQRAVKFYISDSAHSYQISIRASTTQIRLRDDQAGADIDTVTVSPGTILTDSGVEILVALANGKASVWWRGNDHLDAKGWNNLSSNKAVGDGGAAAINRVQIGHHVSPGSGSVESYFQEFSISFLKTGAGQFYPLLYNGFINPGDLQTKDYPSYGNEIYVTEGMFLSTQDGPAQENDSFSIDPSSAYSLDNIFFSHSPSPQNGWRSKAITGSGAVPSEFIAIKLDSNDENIQFMSDLIGLHLEGVNFREFTIEGYDSGTTSWTVLATVSSSIALGSYRYGNRLKPDSSGSAPYPYFFHHELSGWIAQLAHSPHPVYRDIVTNSEGSWRGVVNYRPATIQLSGTQASDPANPSISLIPDKLTVIFSMLGRRFSAIGIRIAAQNTKTNDFRIGHLSLGPVHVLAPQYGRGREISYEANTETYDQPDGTIRTRVRGKGRRSYRVSWSDPVDMSQVFPYDGSPSPDYYYATNTAGNEVVASAGDLPFNILGFCDHLDGSSRPIVYLPKISVSTAPADDIRILKRKEEHALCLINDEVAIEHVIGSEFAGASKGECFRISTIDLTEVV